MTAFADIEARAAERKGDFTAQLLTPLADVELAATADDRWLSQMTRCVFEAGFNWDLINKRWPQFEAAFEGFGVDRWVFFSDDDLSAVLKAPGLVANAQKIVSVGGNARFLAEIIDSHGSAGAWFASWPAERYLDLCAELKARGSRLGGVTGQRVMRRMGKESLLLSPSVIKALVHWGAAEGEPTSKKALAELQGVLNGWRSESGRNLTHISQILAWSVD